MKLTTADFDYELPANLIAQHPIDQRDRSRLLQVERHGSALKDMVFRDLTSILSPGDLLVLNESRVIRARLRATRDNGRPAEVLLVHPETDGTWSVMVHPGGKLKVGRRVTFGSVEAEIVSVDRGGLRRISFPEDSNIDSIMEEFGEVPLPPYIERSPEDEDEKRYQTVYARNDGSIAAPTAGLHFTPELLDELKQLGVQQTTITLHVGPGTFKPVSSDDPSQHRMHSEWYSVPEETAGTINEVRSRGGRIVAVGTTSVRVLESCASNGRAMPGEGWTDIFITPGYEFRLTDGLITNFHLPRSTLIMLVAAFCGLDNTMNAYRHAVDQKYRFYSYGDAMVII